MQLKITCRIVAEVGRPWSMKWLVWARRRHSSGNAPSPPRPPWCSLDVSETDLTLQFNAHKPTAYDIHTVCLV